MFKKSWNSDAGWDDPQLNNRLDIDEVELVLPLLPKNGVEDRLNDNQTAQTSAQTSAQTPADKVLQIIKDNPYITRKAIAEILDRTPRAIQDSINKLKKEGKILRVGPATYGGHWEVIEVE